ncbi:hypothetical protein HY620_02955 [Candidatus Uhrbacteria bacterium]|nr:hypothetical protein [Candidatus Uhrbacteria bacterium]
MEVISSPFTFFDVSNPFQAMWLIFSNGGWFVIGLFLLNQLWRLWMHEIQAWYFDHIQHVLLAINVPKQTEQTPKSVENIFAHMIGLHEARGTLKERYWLGKIQPNFALELVSDGGNIQYYVRLPRQYRNVFESALFAQYPDAEVAEAPDYTEPDYHDPIPRKWPNDTHDMWGCEFALERSAVYPIKTHPQFVDQVSGLFKDPMASLLEFMSTIGPGEKIMIQITCLPTIDTIYDKATKEVRKIIKADGGEDHGGGGIFGGLAISLESWWAAIWRNTLGEDFEVGGKTQKREQAPLPSIMQHLSPGEKATVEAIQMKASKPVFLCKVRWMYVGRKEVFKKTTAIGGVVGAFRQYNTSDCNAWKVESMTKTSVRYLFTNYRVNRRKYLLFRAYWNRSNARGRNPFFLNIEELATMWHFPLIDTKAPLISKAVSRRAEPPPQLPMRSMERPRVDLSPSRDEKEEETKHDVPDNLPFV